MNNAQIQALATLVIPVAGTYVITGTVLAENQVVEAGDLDVWLSPATVSVATAFVSTTTGVGGVQGRNAFAPVQLITVQTILAGATIFLVGFNNTPNIIIHSNTVLENVAKCTGIEAWRIF